jgi:outer membrane protein OmpA-like peptidoglycan-associated protein
MRTLISAMLASILLTGGVAQAATLSLRLGGTEFQGIGPAFEVKIGDSIVSSGTVSVVSGQEFSVDVPDTLAASPGPLALRLTNDAYGDATKDRNLFVFAVKLSEHDIALQDFTIYDGGKSLPRSLRDEHLELWRNSETAVADLSGLAAEPSASTILPPMAPTDDPTAREAAKLQEKSGGAIAEPKAANCTGRALLRGIPSDASGLTKDQVGTLRTVLNAALDGTCSVTITGYASVDGPAAVNVAVSLARARLVVDYLSKRGVTFAATKVVGAGGTRELGPTVDDNRAVTVELRKALE